MAVYSLINSSSLGDQGAMHHDFYMARKRELLCFYHPSMIFISVVYIQTYFVVMSCSSLNMAAWMFLQAKCTTGGSFHKANIIAHQNNL